jgi:hypothetical protein
MQFSVPIVGALIGAVILFFGRKLFWLCVAAVGFAAGVEIAPHLVQEPSPLLALTIALVLGLIGALLALFLQKIAIAVLGCGRQAGGAQSPLHFCSICEHSTIIFVIGGIIGAVLLLVLFDWAHGRLLSSAHLIQSSIVLPPSDRQSCLSAPLFSARSCKPHPAEESAIDMSSGGCSGARRREHGS